MDRGDRLPATTVQDVRDGRDVLLRAPARGSVVLFLSHEADCAGCRAYIEALAAGGRAFRVWDGRLLVVVPDVPDAVGGASPPDPGPRVALVADPGRRLAHRLGLPHGSLVIADRFGECFEVFRATEGDEPPAGVTAARQSGAPPRSDAPRRSDAEDAHRAFPDLQAITEWLRFLGTQCPECGVPDAAGYGEWTAPPPGDGR